MHLEITAEKASSYVNEYFFIVNKHMEHFESSCFASRAISPPPPPPPCLSKMALSQAMALLKYPSLISAGNGVTFWSLSIIGMNVTGVSSFRNGVRGGWLKATHVASQKYKH
jgi:hypothetical protein